MIHNPANDHTASSYDRFEQNRRDPIIEYLALRATPLPLKTWFIPLPPKTAKKATPSDIPVCTPEQAKTKSFASYSTTPVHRSSRQPFQILSVQNRSSRAPNYMPIFFFKLCLELIIHFSLHFQILDSPQNFAICGTSTWHKSCFSKV